MRQETEVELMRLAARQLGLVTSEQVRALGVSAWIVGRRVEARAWSWVHRGVLKLGPNALTSEQRDLAALLAAGPGAVLSHHSAAKRLWLDVPRTARVQVTIAMSRRIAPLEGVEVHRSRDLLPADVTTRWPFRITKLGRTVLDLASVLEPGWLRAVFDSALRRGHWNRKWMALALEEHGAGRRGADRLRSLLDAPENGEISDSTLESLAMELGLATGRKPLPHQVLSNGMGFSAEVDFAWPEVRLCVELDGYATHASREAFKNDRARDRGYRSIGWTVMRFTWDEVTQEPQRVVNELSSEHVRCARALERARAG